jgi:hypothetical protein
MYPFSHICFCLFFILHASGALGQQGLLSLTGFILCDPNPNPISLVQWELEYGHSISS